MFLLDTNILSELRKPRPHAAVVSWYFSVPLSLLAVPSIAFYEMQAGVEITRTQARHKAAEIETWIDSLSRDITMLPLDYASAREAARLMAGHSQNLLEDAMIAAIARVHRYTVATRNIKDFRHFNVPLVNPFDYNG